MYDPTQLIRKSTTFFWLIFLTNQTAWTNFKFAEFLPFYILQEMGSLGGKIEGKILTLKIILPIHHVFSGYICVP